MQDYDSYPSAGYRRSSAPQASFAQRAALDPNFGHDDEDDELYTLDKPSRNQPSDWSASPPYKQNTHVHRVREPQAAFHVPNTRNYKFDPDLSSPERDSYASYHHRPAKPTLQIPADYSAQPTQASQPRKSSIPDRSPLQKLEGRLDGISKEEKRARMEEAEQRLNQRANHTQNRIVSAGRRPDYTTPTANDAIPRRVISDPRHRPLDSAQQNQHASRGSSYNIPANQTAITSPRHPQEDRRQPRRYSDQFNEQDDSVDRRYSQHRVPVKDNRHSQRFDSPQFASFTEGGFQNDPRERQHTAPSTEAAVRGPDNLGRSNSKKLQKKNPPRDNLVGRSDSRKYNNAPYQTFNGQPRRNSLQMSGMDEPSPSTGSQYVQSRRMSQLSQHDPISPESTIGRNKSPTAIYRAAAGPVVDHTVPPIYTNRLPPVSPFEWKSAGVAKLELEDLALDDAITRSPRSANNDPPREDSTRRISFDVDGASPETLGYQPALHAVCGPLLRYTGLRREKRPSRQGVLVEREIWRGSVMIVTADGGSSYSTAPVLKLFAQPMDPLSPLQQSHDHRDLPHDYVDPVAGEIKPDRFGEPMYVKPVEAMPEGADVSKDETENGLFERQRSSPNKTRLRSKDGEKAGKYRHVKGVRLHAERRVTFWRFNIEVELGISQARIAYRINNGPATGFWVPARGSTMNIMFHSCNGFSLSVDSNKFSGPDPLWRDVLNSHAMRPYHVMIGGGDQIYNDCVTRDVSLFKEWLQIKNPEHKHNAEFTKAFRAQLETFYLNRYCTWFSRGLFGLANSQIPMINLWDDHDIIDGYGSYPDHFMRSEVFTGLGNVAFNVFMFLGRRIAFVGLDCRTERTRDEIISQQTYDLILSRCRGEIVKGETKHLIVLLTVPIAYPRLNFLENILTSRAMDPIKAIGRTGALGGFVNKFDGGVEILDDLDDHWTAKHHKQERNWFIQELQELAAEKSIRITILGGDVHLGAVGQFYTRKAFGVPKDQDHRYMPNVISSAIVNTPPPVVMSDVLNRRNKVHHLDDETDEDMIPMFIHDIDGKSRKNKTLMPRRNYCTIREYVPGSTPPHSPVDEQPPRRQESVKEDQDRDQRKYPPGSMGRSRTIMRETFRPRSLIRRLSGSRSRDKPRSDSRNREEDDQDDEPVRRRFSFGGRTRASEEKDEDSYFREELTNSNTKANANANSLRDPVRPVSMFHRRPTDIADNYVSQRRDAGDGARDALPDEDPHEINLEGGLDICLNMEVNQRDPSGITVPYRLLVPALFFDRLQDLNTARFKGPKPTLLERIRGRQVPQHEEEYSDEGSGSDRSISPGPVQGDLRTRQHQNRHRPLHPDDRLQFADSPHSQQQGEKIGDARRDSRVSGVDGANDIRYSVHAADNSGSPRNAQPGHAGHAATAPLPPADDFDDDGHYGEEAEGPRKRLGFLGSLKRRFSSRRRQPDWDDLETYNGSGSEDERDFDEPHEQVESRPSGTYRAADEPVFRNDARLQPTESSGRDRPEHHDNNHQPTSPRRSSVDGPGRKGFAGTLNRLSDRLEDRIAKTQQARQMGGQRPRDQDAEEKIPFESNDSERMMSPRSAGGESGSRAVNHKVDAEGNPRRISVSNKAKRFLGESLPDELDPADEPSWREPYSNEEHYNYDDGYDGGKRERRRSWQLWKR
ncbi:hypothetical protein ANO11243_006760 [Dothideomycetidae sp. 11243]|nr:hypothetical protein ANO11243_006760 [fungal sp. No.11243]